MKYLDFKQCWKPNAMKNTLNYCEYLIEKVHYKINELDITSQEECDLYISKINELTKLLMVLQEEIFEKTEHYIISNYNDYLTYRNEYLKYKDRFDIISNDIDELLSKLNIY